MRETKKAASAESAIHCPEKNIRRLEARFQRLFIPQSDSLGRRPRLELT
jgi:hypothetical protein